MLKFFRKHARSILIIVVLSFVITIPASYVFFRRAPKTGAKTTAPIVNNLGSINGAPINERKFAQLTNMYLAQEAMFGQKPGGRAIINAQYMALEQAAYYTYFLNEAIKSKTPVDKKEVNKTIDEIKKNAKVRTGWGLNRWLKKNYKISLKEVKEIITDDLLVKNYLDKVKEELWNKQTGQAAPTATSSAQSVPAKAEPTKAEHAKTEPAKAQTTKMETNKNAKVKAGAQPQPSPEEQKKAAELEKQKNELFGRWFDTLRPTLKIEIFPSSLKAYKLLMENKMDEAAALYQSALSADYNNRDIYSSYFLAQIYDRQGKLPEAIKELRKAVLKMRANASLNDPEIYLTLAGFYNRTGQKKEAASQLAEAEKIAGDDIFTYYGIMLTYQQMGMKAEAEKIKGKIEEIQKKQREEMEKKQKEAEAKAGKKKGKDKKLEKEKAQTGKEHK